MKIKDQTGSYPMDFLKEVSPGHMICTDEDAEQIENRFEIRATDREVKPGSGVFFSDVFLDGEKWGEGFEHPAAGWRFRKV